MQQEIDRANAEFWDELCGSTMAQAFQIKDRSLNSLQKFDEIYFNHYPYLLKHVPVEKFKGKKVLEVGLGYGTLGMKIAQSGADYIGLDIAQGPVNMLNHRLKLLNLPGKAIQGSILKSPVADETMDYVVSIGCYHHTGNIQKCIDETRRILKPGGQAFIMLYNQRSYLQWKNWPVKTLLSVLDDYGLVKNEPKISLQQRAAYDNNCSGESAPETIFASIAQVKKMMKHFNSVSCSKENWNDLCYPVRRLVPRRILLPTLAKLIGLDIYITAKK